MIERYKYINKFRYSIFGVCNQAIPTEATHNPILSEIVLEKLKDVKEEIKADINSITLGSIKAEDVFGNRELEVSELFTNEICLYDFASYKTRYDEYLKGEALQRILPTHKREEIIEKYSLTDKEIGALANIDLMKTETTSIYKYENAEKTSKTYALAKDKESTMHDDRFYVLIMLAHRLYELRRGQIITTEEKAADYSSAPICVSTVEF